MAKMAMTKYEMELRKCLRNLLPYAENESEALQDLANDDESLKKIANKALNAVIKAQELLRK